MRLPVTPPFISGQKLNVLSRQSFAFRGIVLPRIKGLKVRFDSRDKQGWLGLYTRGKIHRCIFESFNSRAYYTRLFGEISQMTGVLFSPRFEHLLIGSKSAFFAVSGNFNSSLQPVTITLTKSYELIYMNATLFRKQKGE